MKDARPGRPNGAAPPAGRGKRRLLLGAAYSSIEPLGLLYLSGLARDLGWEPHIRMVRGHDFSVLDEAVRELKPEIVGYTLYTGNHTQLYAYFDRLRKDHPRIRTVIGGPHATYFPDLSLDHADNVVVSEGFDALGRILKGEAGRGVLYPARLMTFPLPARAQFYKDYPEHWQNPIKNVISMTGCPFACTYCYNSSSIDGTMGSKLSPAEIGRLKCVLGASGRLFPLNMRTCESVHREITDVLELAPATRMFYWQDDTLGVGGHLAFLKEFARRYDLGIRFHGQTRFEMVNPDNRRGLEVLEQLRKIGFDGMTMAIEAADHHVRKEVLNRVMSDTLIFHAMKKLAEFGFRVRTEQITGLPYGATSVKTAINLEADLAILKLNLDLRRQSGLPNVSWATTLIPYLGTRMSDYCIQYGFATADEARNPEAGYHERSVLRHVKEWVGPSLARKKDRRDVWLAEADQERYRDQNTHLRYNFHILAHLSGLPDAERFVERHLHERAEFTTATLNTDLLAYVQDHRHEEGRRIAKRIRQFEEGIPTVTESPVDQDRLRNVSAYAGVLPGDPLDFARRYLRHSDGRDEVARLSNIAKKFLFDTQLYLQEECRCEVYNGGADSPDAA
ncbi:MAG: cobalamin-dependent protein [Verrucomicrobiota bacterium]